MPSMAEILEAMQFEIMYDSNPINLTGVAPYSITFQFESSQPGDMWHSYGGWVGLSAAEKTAVRDALAHIETFLNVDFVEISGTFDPDLNIGKVGLPAGVAGMGGPSVSFFPGTPLNTISNWDGYAVYDNGIDLASGEMNLILHELGHAFGLDHPFDGVPLDPAFDTNHFTLMSYTEDPHSAGDPDGLGFNDAMMLFDVYALQDIWGAASYSAADTTYTGARTANVDLIWDTGGSDTFDASARANAVELDLAQGAFSTFGSYEDVAIGFGVVIENAIGGSGNDVISGNGVANELTGLGGNDQIYGGIGYDKLVGNQGNDTLKGQRGNDTLFGGQDNDKLFGGNGLDRLYGGIGHDKLVGNQGNDTLKGQRGNDTLYGGQDNDKLFGGNGLDRLYGGIGDDALSGGLGADVFVFKLGDDQDRVLDFTDDLDTVLVMGLGTRAAVLGQATETGGDVVFDFGGGDTLVVENTTLALLDNDLTVA